MPRQSETGNEETTTMRPALTPARIAELTAQGVLDSDNPYWFMQVRRDERTRVYTLRAGQERCARNPDIRRTTKGGRANG
jgi:hypothetical protein